MNIDWPKLITEVLKYAEGYTATTPSAIDDLVVRLLKAALEKKYPSFGAGPGDVGAAVTLEQDHRDALDAIFGECSTGSDPS